MVALGGRQAMSWVVADLLSHPPLGYGAASWTLAGGGCFEAMTVVWEVGKYLSGPLLLGPCPLVRPPVLTVVQGTPGMNGCASRSCWRMEGDGEGSVPSGETVDSCGCWPTPPSGPQFGPSATLARGEVGAGAGGAVATGDCGWMATSTPRLQCCLSETVVGGGEADGGVCMPARDGEKISTSGSHSSTFSWLRMPSSSSMNCGLDVPSSWVGAIPSCLDWMSVGGMCVDVC